MRSKREKNLLLTNLVVKKDFDSIFELQIAQTADVSLKKFFILQYVCKEFGIDIATEGELAVEKALYKHLTGEEAKA
jgi:hypothetical protein